LSSVFLSSSFFNLSFVFCVSFIFFFQSFFCLLSFFSLFSSFFLLFLSSSVLYFFTSSYCSLQVEITLIPTNVSFELMSTIETYLNLLCFYVLF
jgi:hypothetical protein